MLKITGCNKVKGTVIPDSDKSISHRAVMLSALAQGQSKVSNLLLSKDIYATIDCFSQLGTRFELDGTTLAIYPTPLRQPSKVLYASNSGTTARLLAGILAGQDFDVTLTGDESLKKRPMGRIITPLQLMGAEISARKGDYCPLQIKGNRLAGITYRQEVSSAQQKSAILLAGLYAQGATTVIEKAKSRNHTEIMLKEMGASVNTVGNSISIEAGKLVAKDWQVPGDISTAAFYLALGAICEGAQVTVKNVGLNPTRTGIIEVLQKMGVIITVTYTQSYGEPYGDITVQGSALKGIEISGEIIPRLIDELPIISVCAAFAKGRTIIKDAGELRVKESNRIACMVEQLRKGGINAYELADGLVIEGGKAIGGEFSSYGDHRIAMSMIVFALCASGQSTITGEDCIDISAPNFISSLQTLVPNGAIYLA